MEQAETRRKKAEKEEVNRRRGRSNKKSKSNGGIRRAQGTKGSRMKKNTNQTKLHLVGILPEVILHL